MRLVFPCRAGFINSVIRCNDMARSWSCRTVPKCGLILISSVLTFFTFRFLSSDRRFFPSRIRSTITVVTAYYAFRSKHSSNEYETWMRNFLTNIPCSLYIFTDSGSLKFLQSMRTGFEDKTHFIVTPFDALEMSKIGQQFWQRQYDMDTEWKIHTPKLYIIWNEKTKFVLKAISENTFDSDFFVWCDIGSFRNVSQIPYLLTFPSPEKIVHLNRNKIYLTHMEKFAKSDFDVGPNELPVHRFHRDVRVGASLFAGHRQAWTAWDTVYYDVLKRLEAAGRFVGKDQTVMANVVVLHPELVELVKPKAYFNGTGDLWFYFQYYFS